MFPPDRLAPPALRRRALLASMASLAVPMAVPISGCSRGDDGRRVVNVDVDGGVDAKPEAPELKPNAARSRPKDDADPRITAYAMELPGLIESAEHGPFIDLVRAIDEVYTGGSISVEVWSLGRIYEGFRSGHADFAFPTLRVGDNAAQLPYRDSTLGFGHVSFVLYSHKRKPLTRPLLEQAMRRGDFEYAIEAPETLPWPFPVQRFTSFDSALRKVAAGRIDALLWAQDEADIALRQLGLKDIRRALFGQFEDVFMVARGARGDYVDRVLGQAIKTLRDDGRLATLYAAIHRPYDDWQP